MPDFNDKDILERLSKLEACSETRWEAHDTESARRHEETTRKLDKIDTRLESLNCGVHSERVGQVEKRCDSIDGRINNVWTAFGIVIIAGIVLGLWINGIVGSPRQREDRIEKVIQADRQAQQDAQSVQQAPSAQQN
jgi:hypothetical protein